MPRFETSFPSAEAVGRNASYRPGTVLPSETSVPAFFGSGVSSEQLTAEGGQTRKVGDEKQRFDGREWVTQGG